MFQTTKVTSSVIQMHWQWCHHSIGHVRFPISVPTQICLYQIYPILPVNEILSLISRNLKRSHDWTSLLKVVGLYIMCGRVLLCVSAHEIWSDYSFTDSKEMTGENITTGHVILTTPTRVVCHPKASTWYTINNGLLAYVIYCICIQNLETLASAVPGVKTENGSRDPDPPFMDGLLITS